MSKVKVEIEGVGTKKAGYATPEYGPFRCGHCIWFKVENSACKHPDVREDKEIEHNSDGDGMVKADGCCNYFRPTSKLIDIPFSKLGM